MKKDLGLVDVILNKEKVYLGNLSYYFKTLFNKAKNLNNPYHNFRHISHVFMYSYFASVYYKNDLSKREIRNILIAALFHDADHFGKKVNDKLNIKNSIKFLNKYILDEDKKYIDDIVSIISATEYPHKIKDSDLNLSQKIIMDADMSQTFSDVWIQQIIFGLSKELNEEPLKLLEKQKDFIPAIKFKTDWANNLFKDKKKDRIIEVKNLLKVLK